MLPKVNVVSLEGALTTPKAGNRRQSIALRRKKLRVRTVSVAPPPPRLPRVPSPPRTKKQPHRPSHGTITTDSSQYTAFPSVRSTIPSGPSPRHLVQEIDDATTEAHSPRRLMFEALDRYQSVRNSGSLSRELLAKRLLRNAKQQYLDNLESPRGSRMPSRAGSDALSASIGSSMWRGDRGEGERREVEAVPLPCLHADTTATSPNLEAALAEQVHRLAASREQEPQCPHLGRIKQCMDVMGRVLAGVHGPLRDFLQVFTEEVRGGVYSPVGMPTYFELAEKLLGAFQDARNDSERYCGKLDEVLRENLKLKAERTAQGDEVASLREQVEQLQNSLARAEAKAAKDQAGMRFLAGQLEELHTALHRSNERCMEVSQKGIPLPPDFRSLIESSNAEIESILRTPYVAGHLRLLPSLPISQVGAVAAAVTIAAFTCTTYTPAPRPPLLPRRESHMLRQPSGLLATRLVSAVTSVASFHASEMSLSWHHDEEVGPAGLSDSSSGTSELI